MGKNNLSYLRGDVCFYDCVEFDNFETLSLSKEALPKHLHPQKVYGVDDKSAEKPCLFRHCISAPTDLPADCAKRKSYVV